MPADTIYHEFPYAADAIVHAQQVIGQTPEQMRSEWNGTSCDAIDRRLMAGLDPMGWERRRTGEARTEQFFDPDDERR